MTPKAQTAFEQSFRDGVHQFDPLADLFIGDRRELTLVATTDPAGRRHVWIVETVGGRAYRINIPARSISMLAGALLSEATTAPAPTPARPVRGRTAP